MYIVHSIVEVPEAKADEVIGLYRNRSRLVNQAPGFIGFQLWQNERRLGEQLAGLVPLVKRFEMVAE